MNDHALMLSGYFECAFGTVTDDNDEMLEMNYGYQDISEEAMIQASDDCAMFLDRCEELAIEWWDKPPPLRNYTVAEHLGHDFWLTRNGHGAGFWDGDWPLHGDELDAVAKTFGETDLYVGDDGLLYFTR